MKKGIKIFVLCILLFLAVAFTGLAIVNYLILPPKVSSDAQKFRYNSNNLIKLKSITVDTDKVIYEFGASNKYFKKRYIETNCKEYETLNIFYLELYLAENYHTIKGSEYNSNNYNIVSTLTSNFLIISLDEERETNSVKCFYTGQEEDSFDYMYITVNSGYENPGISIIYDDILENISTVKYQTYDKEKKKWSEISGWSDYYSKIVRDNKRYLIVQN